MNINKTADECVVEIGIALLQCFADSVLSLKQKQDATMWIGYFLNYQDAINTNDTVNISRYQRKLMKTFSPHYYKNALQEFKNANILYNNAFYLSKIKLIIPDYSTNETILNINSFSSAFLTTFKKYQRFIKDYDKIITDEFIADFQLLSFLIHYHLCYLFKTDLEPIVKKLVKVLKTKIKLNFENRFDEKKPEQLLVNVVLNENKFFFERVQQINLINYINHLEDIFDSTEITKKMVNLVFMKPKALKVSMNQLLKRNNLNFYEEIWNHDHYNSKKSTILMHFIAYETYFVQGHGNHKHYEDLILKKINIDNNYLQILEEFKTINKT